MVADNMKSYRLSLTQAENFFLESLESWRQAQGIEVMTLIGHSLGGYLSTVSTLDIL